MNTWVRDSLWLLKVFIFLVSGLLTACNYSSSGDSVRELREALTNDFADNPSGALAIYKPLWKGRSCSAVPHCSEVIQIALAGELMKHDPGSYESYYSYVIGKLPTDSSEIAIEVVSALRNARGEESANILTEAALHGKRGLAEAALVALDYRWTEIKYGDGNADELNQLEGAIRAYCARPIDSNFAKGVCANYQ